MNSNPLNRRAFLSSIASLGASGTAPAEAACCPICG